MILNLQKIIEVPGEIPFSYEMDMSGEEMYSVKTFLTPLKVRGRVVNSAGVLSLEADLEVALLCECDRCSGEYEDSIKMKISASLSAELQDKDNPDIFILDGDSVDLDEIIRTIFILQTDTKFLCRPDCMGICPKCGKDLNEGPCECKPDMDPRLAVLEQLLNDQR